VVSTLSAEGIERLRTWTREIAAALLPPDVQTRRDGHWLRFLGRGGLLINENGSWWWHSAKAGGHSPLRLIEVVGEYGPEEAVEWAAAWLRAHAGFGSCTGSSDIEESHPASAADAADILRRLVEPCGTIIEKYWASRQITAPFPDCVKAVRNARLGEDAVAAILTARGRVCGVELTYVDATGQRSAVEPKRRTFKLERSPDAVFDIPPPGKSTDIVITEGVPDLLTTFRFGGRRCRTLGLPGIATLQCLRLPPGTGKATVIAHGDDPNSPAATALQAGLDRLLLDGFNVHVTAIPPAGEDANSILQKAGVDGLRALLDSAQPAKLSLNGEIEKLARLSELDYARIRKTEAKRLEIPLGILDKEVHKHRAANAAAPPGSDWDDVSTAGVEHETVDLADTLDGIVKELKRYVVASEQALATIALWCAHAHLVHHKLIKLTVSPRLGIQARDYGSGKTITLECCGCLVPNPVTASNITASSLFRTIALEHPTFLLDEVHLLLQSRRNPELLQIMNASHRRKSAKIRTSDPLPNGGWQPVEYDVWCTMALASVGELPRDQQERCVIVNLNKALGTDVAEHLEDGTSPELEKLYTKLFLWAAALEELPRPKLPEVLQRQHGRIGDNWRPLLAVAELAGDQWRQKALQAALAAVTSEQQLTPIQRLLLSIRKAFRTFDPEKPEDALETGALLHLLLTDPDEEWSRANGGRPITPYWLRDNLRGLLHPPRSADWWEGPKGAQMHRSGYRRVQFEAAWRTYLAGVQDFYSEPPSETSGRPGVSGEPFDKYRFSDTSSGGPSGGSGGPNSAAENTPDTPDRTPDQNRKPPTISVSSPDPPGPPDLPEGKGKGKTGLLPNGEDRPDKRRCRRRGALSRDVRTFAAENPNLTPEQIGKKFGVSRSRIERILSSHAN
jgi:putative DNA primase/helicase